MVSGVMPVGPETQRLSANGRESGGDIIGENSFWRKMARRFGTPLDWSNMDKCAAGGMLALPFLVQETVLNFLFIRRNPAVSYLEPGYQHFYSWSILCITVVWMGMIGYALYLRGRDPDNIFVTRLMIFYSSCYLVFVVYSYGIFTTPMFTLIPCVGILGVLLFPRKISIQAYYLAFGALAVLGILEQLRAIPYAPLLRRQPYSFHRLDSAWVLNSGAITYVFSLAVMALCGAMFDLWRDRESRLAESTRELERSRDMLETHVAARTEELEKSNQYLLEEIVRRRKAEEARLAIERRMLEAQKLESLGVLAGGVAHDFNNLISSILGNAELVQADLLPGSAQLESVRAITQAARRAGDLTRQLLAYAGKAQFSIEPVNLNELAEEMVQILRVSIPKDIKVEFRLAPDLPAVEGDPTQLRQVVMNLITNAAEAIGENAGTITIKTDFMKLDEHALADGYRPSTRPPGNYVSIEIRDTGCGIGAETLERIFDPFFTTKFTGRGLGLPAVRGIVNGHRGAVKVTSRPGEGSAFRVLFPALPGAAPRKSESSGDPLAWRGSGRILVVDDEEPMRAVMQRILVRLGFDVDVAASGAEGLARFRDQGGGYRCVLMDLVMPGMTGLELLQEVRALSREVRIVLMSGYSEDSIATGRDPLTGFLQKPISIEDLARTMRDICRD